MGAYRIASYSLACDDDDTLLAIVEYQKSVKGNTHLKEEFLRFRLENHYRFELVPMDLDSATTPWEEWEHIHLCSTDPRRVIIQVPDGVQTKKCVTLTDPHAIRHSQIYDTLFQDSSFTDFLSYARQSYNNNFR